MNAIFDSRSLWNVLARGLCRVVFLTYSDAKERKEEKKDPSQRQQTTGDYC